MIRRRIKENNSGMFLFEYENQNRIINVALNLPQTITKTKGNRMIKEMNKTFSASNATKYGSKWFLNPNTWNERMKISNQPELTKLANNLKTNQTFAKMVETFQSKISEKADPQKQDIVQNFENEIMMIKRDF